MNCMTVSKPTARNAMRRDPCLVKFIVIYSHFRVGVPLSVTTDLL